MPFTEFLCESRDHGRHTECACYFRRRRKSHDFITTSAGSFAALPRVRERLPRGVSRAGDVFARAARLWNVGQFRQQTGDMVSIVTALDLPGGFSAGSSVDEASLRVKLEVQVRSDHATSPRSPEPHATTLMTLGGS